MSTTKKPNPAVSFRLPPEYARLLNDQAVRDGLSRGALARLLVIEALADADRLRLFEEVAAVRHALARLKRLLRTATVALLCDAGKAELDEARGFVASAMGEEL